MISTAKELYCSDLEHFDLLMDAIFFAKDVTFDKDEKVLITTFEDESQLYFEGYNVEYSG